MESHSHSHPAIDSHGLAHEGYLLQDKLREALQQLSQSYGILDSWLMQFVNQNLYLSTQETIDFIQSVQQIQLSSNQKILPSPCKQDSIYCLLEGKANLLRNCMAEYNSEIKKLRLTGLHNYKASKSEECFAIEATSDCVFLRFALPFNREGQCVLNTKREFLCDFFGVEFNTNNFDVLDLFKETKQIGGERLTALKSKLYIVKKGICNYSKAVDSESLSPIRMTLLDRSSPFALNYEQFLVPPAESSHEITVKESEIICLEAPISKLLAKTFYHPLLIKLLRDKCQEEQRWVNKFIQSKIKQYERTSKVIAKKGESRDSSVPNFLKVGDNSNNTTETDLLNSNLMSKTISKMRALNGKKRGSLQVDLGKRETFTPADLMRRTGSVAHLPKTAGTKDTTTEGERDFPWPNSKTPRSKRVDLGLLSDFEETIRSKNKILNRKMKLSRGSHFLYEEAPNASCKNLQLRLIHSGHMVVPTPPLPHTDSRKKMHTIKAKYIEKIERSNRVGMQAMIIHSSSRDDLESVQIPFQQRKSSLSMKRLTANEYHNYLLMGEPGNPREEPLEQVHRKIKILSDSSSSVYNHNQHLKNKAKLYRYSTHKMKPERLK